MVMGREMHPVDVEQALKTMVIWTDTREQPTERAKKRYETLGVPHERHKLDFGDYTAAFTLPDGTLFTLESIAVIERKLGYSELCTCYTHDRERFTREFERAKKVGAKTYLLLENSSWEMAYAGKYRSKMKPQSLIGSMLAWLARYDCQIIMCKEETSGKLIHDILYREGKEALLGMVDM